jgi:drug/metabolite transporter (DMT)-like permease
MKRRQLAQAVLWMVGALLSFSAIALGIRSLGGTFTTFEILSLRTGGGLIAMLAVGAMRPHLFRTFTTRRLGLHAIRNGFNLAAQYLWTASIALLPLATVFALEFTTPAWTALLAVLLLKERLTTSRVGALVCGLLGVLVIVRPGVATFQPAALLVLSAALGYAATYVATKKLTATDSTFAIVLWMNIMQFPVAYAFSDPLFFLRINLGHLPGVLAVAFAGLTSHYCLTKALSSGDASVVIPLDFLRLPLIAVLAWLIYGEAIEPFVFAGAALIISGVIWNLHAEARRHATRPVAT